jgi:hypothetical protein
MASFLITLCGFLRAQAVVSLLDLLKTKRKDKLWLLHLLTNHIHTASGGQGLYRVPSGFLEGHHTAFPPADLSLSQQSSTIITVINLLVGFILLLFLKKALHTFIRSSKMLGDYGLVLDLSYSGFTSSNIEVATHWGQVGATRRQVEK